MILADFDLTTITVVGTGAAGIIGAVLTFALRWRKQSSDQWQDLNDRLTKRIEDSERQSDIREKKCEDRYNELADKHSHCEKNCQDKCDELEGRCVRLQSRVFSLQSQIDKLSSDQLKTEARIDISGDLKSAIAASRTDPSRKPSDKTTEV